MEVMTKDKETIYRFIIGFCIIAFMIISMLWVFREPQGFTQLYFEDFKDLPKEISDVEYSINFTVASFENEITEYSYRTTTEKGKLTLLPKEKKTVEIKFKGDELEDEGKFEVVLENENQSIYFAYKKVKKA